MTFVTETAPAQLFAATLCASCPNPDTCSTKVPGQFVAFCRDGAEASVPFPAFFQDLSATLWITVPFFIWAVALPLLREMIKSPRTCWAALSFHAKKDEKVSDHSFGMLLPSLSSGVASLSRGLSGKVWTNWKEIKCCYSLGNIYYRHGG